MRVVWTRLADRQASEVVETIAADNPDAAHRWLDRLLQQTRSLASFPDRGRLVPELRRSDVRELLVHRGNSNPTLRTIGAPARALGAEFRLTAT